MFDTMNAPEFAEGTIDFASATWFCVEHETSVANGKDCAFCVHDTLGPVGFDRWARRQ